MKDYDMYDEQAAHMIGAHVLSIESILVAQRFRADAQRIARLEELLESSREVAEKRRLEIERLNANLRFRDAAIKAAEASFEFFKRVLRQPCLSCGHVRQPGYSPES